MSIILRHCRLQSRIIGVGCGRNGHPFLNRVAANDKAAGMNTCSPDGSFQHFSILDGISFTRIDRRFRLAKLRCTLDSVLQVHLQTIGQAVGNGFAQCVRFIQRQLFHTGDILNGVLCGHTSIGNDMRTVLMAIFIHNPSQHPTTSVIVKIGIDIRQIHTIRIKETLEQQVIL